MTAASEATPAPHPPHERFLQALTPEMRRQFLVLPSVLEAHEDWFPIFTARKSVCIADALIRLGYWRPTSDYSSTRALDGDLSVLSGRKVLIIEDLVASGRTLARAIETVRAAGASEVKCFALSVEGPRHDTETHLGVGFVSPYLQSSLDDSVRHATGIVRAFAALPRPYNIDWPVLAFGPNVNSESASRSGWRRLPSIEEAGPISFEPTTGVLGPLTRAMPEAMTAVLKDVHLAKVRLYPVTSPQEHFTHTFAVPIMALGTLSEPALGAALSDYSNELGVSAPTYASASEGYRLLQFVFGDIIGSAFAASLDASLLPSPTSDSDYLFMPGPIRQWLAEVRPAIDRWTRRRSEQATGTKTESLAVRTWAGIDDMNRQLRVADSALSEMFLTRYVDSREYGLRNSFRQAAISERRGIAEQIRNVERPGDGASFTAGELRACLQSLPGALTGPLSDRDIVSIYLDRAIDAGEVVPDVDDVCGVVGRRFRPGEIINFERDTQTQVETMLHVYARNANVETFSQDLLQKLVVGFVAYLLKRGQLVDHSGGGPSSRDVGRLQRRYHLRGAVLDEVGADFVAKNHVPEITRQLLVAKIIKPHDRGYELARSAPVVDPSLNVVEATQFGVVIAEVMTVRDDDGGRVVKDVDQLARLITLSGAVEQTLALGADLSIAAERLSSNPNKVAWMQSAAFAEAVGQGLAKASWIEQKRSSALLGAVRKRVATTDDLRASATSSVLAALEPSEGGESDARKVVRALQQWFRCVHLVISVRSTLAVTHDDDERAAELASRLSNRAFLALGGATERARTFPGAKRLMRHVRRDPVLRSEEVRDLVRAAHLELVDRAADLLRECYAIGSRMSVGAVRTAPMDRCLLLRRRRIGGASVDLPGVSALLEANPDAELDLLAGFHCIGALKPNFDPRVVGRDLVVALDSAVARSVLVLDMPAQFAPFRDSTRQVAVVPRGFKDLAQIASAIEPEIGTLSVLVPQHSSTAHATAIRASGRCMSVIDLLGCRWEHWAHRPHGGTQLPLLPGEDHD